MKRIAKKKIQQVIMLRKRNSIAKCCHTCELRRCIHLVLLSSVFPELSIHKKKKLVAAAHKIIGAWKPNPDWYRRIFPAYVIPRI